MSMPPHHPGRRRHGAGPRAAWAPALLAALVLATGLAAEPREYRIAPAEGGRLTLEVSKTRLMSGRKHVFVFERYEGRIAYDPSVPEQSQVEVSIDGASLACQDDWVTAKDLKKIEDLALTEMLQVSKHPRMRFVSKQIKSMGEGRYGVEGDLTLRGMSGPVLVDASVWAEGESGLAVEGTAAIKMKA